MRKIAFLMLIIGLMLAGCGQAAPQAAQPTAGGPSSGPPPQTSVPQATSQPTTPPAPVAATSLPSSPPATPSLLPATSEATPGRSPGLSVKPPDTLVATAQRRLAMHLGVGLNTLMLQSANKQDWPDGAIGCPKEGLVYPQIITPGFLLIFSNQSQSQTYEVHTGRSEEQMVLCENKSPIELPGDDGAVSSGATSAPDAASAPLVELARQALAKELGIKAGEITWSGTEKIEWNDSSLGCPKPGMNYLQVVTPGYRITLEAQGRRYEYHTDSTSHVVRCDKKG